MPEDLITIASRHQAHVERLKSGDVQELKAFLQRMERSLREQLAGEEITQWTRSRLEQQLAAVRQVLRSTYGQFERLWRQQVADLAVYEAGFEGRAIGQAVRPGVQHTIPDERQLVAAVFTAPLSVEGPHQGKLLEPFFRDVTLQDQTRIENAIRLAYAQGQTTNDLFKTIRGTRANNFRDGLMANAGRSAEVVARTSLQHASSQAREQVWRDNTDIMTGVEWVSTLDSRTSTICRTLDGEVFKVDEGPRPPAHPNCRSTTRAVLDDRFSMLEEGATRRARAPDGDVGYVSAKQTYYSWLKKQPAGFQDSVIGPKRGKLLRQGGLSAERFAELQLHRNFEPATLEEIKRLEPTAFERAGL